MARRVCGYSPSPCETDGALLERFVRCGEESAFTAIVRRHGPYVLGVCRRVLRQEQDAEDVAQATFLLLAQKADRVPWRASVRGWLRAAACRLALNVRTASARRRLRLLATRETDTEQLEASPLSEVACQEVRRLLDGELHRLPEKYRAPVVLCYLEGKTNQEAARLLGWPVGSMSRRLARARILLQERLTQRGLALAALLLGLLLVGCWLYRAAGPSGPGTAPLLVAQVMGRFADSPDGRAGGESVLHRLAAVEDPALDVVQLRALAAQAAWAADQIQGHGSPETRGEWDRYAEEMSRSALVLAQTVQTGNERDMLRAARRLNSSCQVCHAVFRR